MHNISRKIFLIPVLILFFAYFMYLVISVDQIYFTFKLVFFYYLIPLLIFLFLLIIIISNNLELFYKSLVIFFSFVLALIIFETFLILGKDDIQIKYLQKQKNLLGDSFNSKSYFEHLISEREKDNFLYPLIYSIKDQIPLIVNEKKIYSFGGVSNREILWCNDEGIFQTFFSDRYGFNNPDYLWDRDIDIFLLGDSYLMGHCVDFEHTIAERVRKYYPNTVNLSYSMGGALSMLGVLSEYSLHSSPDIVIKFIYANDITDTFKEYKFNTLRNYLNDEIQNLVINSEKINEITNRMAIEIINDYSSKIDKDSKSNVFEINKNLLNKKNEWSINLLFEVLKFNFTRNLLHIPSLKSYAVNYDYKLYSDVLNQIKIKTNELNSKLLIVILPSYKMIGKKSLQIENTIKILKELNLDFINIHEAFNKEGIKKNQIFKFPSSHYNELGYNLVSEYVLKYLSEKNYIVD